MPLKILMQMQSPRPQKAALSKKKHHMTSRSLRSVHAFLAEFTPLPNPQNLTFYNAFQSARHPQKVPLHTM